MNYSVLVSIPAKVRTAYLLLSLDEAVHFGLHLLAFGLIDERVVRVSGTKRISKKTSEKMADFN